MGGAQAQGIIRRAIGEDLWICSRHVAPEASCFFDIDHEFRVLLATGKICCPHSWRPAVTILGLYHLLTIKPVTSTPMDIVPHVFGQDDALGSSSTVANPPIKVVVPLASSRMGSEGQHDAPPKRKHHHVAESTNEYERCIAAPDGRNRTVDEEERSKRARLWQWLAWIWNDWQRNPTMI